jgi:PAS domain S-box-containing protein
LEHLELYRRRGGDFIERFKADEALRESNATLAAESKAMAWFYEAGLRLWHATSLQEGLEATLEGTIDLLGADMGAVHLLDSESKLLRVVAYRGLKQEYLEHFSEVPAEHGIVSQSMRSGTPLVIEDTELDRTWSSNGVRSVRRAAGYRAFVLAPLTDSRGTRLGMLSIHFHSPHRPKPSELRWLELYQRRAADFILRIRARDALETSEERLRLALEAGHMATWDSDARTGAHVWNDEFYRLFGYQIGEVQPSHAAWARRIHPDDREAAEAVIANANREHKAYVNECRLLLPDGSVRWIRARGRFIYYDGEPVRTIGLVEDVTEARQQIETQRVLVAELQHRTRNLMAVVQSIASRTLDTADSLADFEGHFNHRLEALSRVQSLLSRADDEPITLRALIAMELEALGLQAASDRITSGGPDAPLRKSAVEMLSLAIHELLTNAIKYGAFACETGRLSVTWGIERTLANQRLVFEWIERGITVSPSADPGRSGYGRILIEEALPYSLSAETKFVLNGDTLRCWISIPIETSSIV